MIKITNGRMTLTVTKSSFETLFKEQGYIPLEPIEAPEESAEAEMGVYPIESKTDALEDPRQEESDPEEEAEDRPLEEIPLTEMDYYQLSAYADQLGIDRTGLRSTKELRRVIRAAKKGA